jgi:hypothetical protein
VKIAGYQLLYAVLQNNRKCFERAKGYNENNDIKPGMTWTKDKDKDGREGGPLIA